MACKTMRKGHKGIDLFNTCGLQATPSKPDFSYFLLAATTPDYGVSSVHNARILHGKTSGQRLWQPYGQAVKYIPLGNQFLAQDNIFESFRELKIALRLDPLRNRQPGIGWRYFEVEVRTRPGSCKEKNSRPRVILGSR